MILDEFLAVATSATTTTAIASKTARTTITMTTKAPTQAVNRKEN